MDKLLWLYYPWEEREGTAIFSFFTFRLKFFLAKFGIHFSKTSLRKMKILLIDINKGYTVLDLLMSLSEPPFGSLNDIKYEKFMYLSSDRILGFKD